MAFRDVRTAVASSLLLALAAGCQNGDMEGYDQTRPGPELPPDTVRLPADQLARLPWYGVQALSCDSVDRFMTEAGLDTSTTRTIRLRLVRDSLVVTPRVAVAGIGDTVQIRSDSLVWVVHFKDMSPAENGNRTIRRQGTAPEVSREQASPRGSRLVIPDDESQCGRYYFFVAAYHPDRPDRVYLADPPMWIRY